MSEDGLKVALREVNRRIRRMRIRFLLGTPRRGKRQEGSDLSFERRRDKPPTDAGTPRWTLGETAETRQGKASKNRNVTGGGGNEGCGRRGERPYVHSSPSIRVVMGIGKPIKNTNRRYPIK